MVIQSLWTKSVLVATFELLSCIHFSDIVLASNNHACTPLSLRCPLVCIVSAGLPENRTRLSNRGDRHAKVLSCWRPFACAVLLTHTQNAHLSSVSARVDRPPRSILSAAAARSSLMSTAQCRRSERDRSHGDSTDGSGLVALVWGAQVNKKTGERLWWQFKEESRDTLTPVGGRGWRLSYRPAPICVCESSSWLCLRAVSMVVAVRYDFY
jgi:hypothetical protein